MVNDKRCILIVDDDIKILRSLKDFLSANNFCVFEATDGKKALDVFYENNTKIDMILLDVMMPNMDGFEVLKEIRKSFLVPVIMLTARGQEYDQLNGFKTGADDYIPKPFSPSLLLARMEAVFKRIGKSAESILSAGKIRINNLKRIATVDENQITLTPKEFDLLYYFVLNRGLTLTRDQILNSVWGYEFEGDFRTVDTHVKQLRIKLGHCAGYIRTIHRVGYQFEVE
ncbi:MAG: response regulator transcription factor [Clostridiaceae bacterium]|nr:response regulator transcription factor [Clostridiaceae bacterium]